MSEFFDAMSSAELLLWCLAIPSSLFGVVITLLTLLGAGEGEVDLDTEVEFETDVELETDADLDTEAEPHGLALARYFSLKNIVLFFMGFSWTGIVGLRGGRPAGPSALLGLLVGLILAFSFMKLFRWISGLNQSGNLSAQAVYTTIGNRGKVYLPLPAGKSGSGKIMVEIQGRLRELPAMVEGEGLPTGTPVRVVGVDESVLIVEPDTQEGNS